MPARLDYLPIVSYEQAHLRLKTDRERASDHLCSECGGAGQEWAYMGGCPRELHQDGKAYSLDQTRYEPMCVRCHRRHDAAVRDSRTVNVCPRGHDWAENEGTRVKRTRGTGVRYCSACHRENSAAYRARRRRAA